MSPPQIVKDGHPTLRHEERQALGDVLQGMLVELLDLSLLGKQAHWNVTGSHLPTLHLQLDELVDTWRDLADRIAERAVALGVSPDGRSSTVAHARTHMEHAAEYDRVTEDVLVEVVEELERQQWMMRVQAGGGRGHGTVR
jgi:starvation-inducible DNA-binding protein